jgi:AbrB family looped-hinge helix DNA binding protein
MASIVVSVASSLYGRVMAMRIEDLIPGDGSRAQPVRAKVSGNGQVSIPAAVRRRWGSKEVVVIDKGDRVIVRPALSLAELRGCYKDAPGPTTDELRAEDRAEEARREGLVP